MKDLPIAPKPLPKGLVVAGSVAIALHLIALVTLVLAAPSGPWPTQFGSSPSIPPPFVQGPNNFFVEVYWRPLRMTHNYHFISNRPEQPAVRFEVKLKDALGQIQTRVFPDPKANFWVRQRQELLAQKLMEDSQVQPPTTEVVPGVNQPMPTKKVWQGEPGKPLVLDDVPIHLIPRDRPVFEPSQWSQVVAKSYMRFLCRKHGAAGAELIRQSHGPIRPENLLLGNILPGTFDPPMLSNFGEFHAN